MTRQEAIARIKRHKVVHKLYEPRATYISEAFDMAIEALEREPKRGKWLDDNNSFNSFYANCSECGYQMDKHAERGYHNYCPYCGARMRSSEE